MGMGDLVGKEGLNVLGQHESIFSKMNGAAVSSAM